MIKERKKTISILLVILFTLEFINATGKVYLVLGSDTAIWNGMNVARFDNTYVLDLFTDPMENAYHVMDPTWRNQFVDSYGTPLKLTWWMMGGNIFRYATNNNVPLNNTMTLYLMKKYHGEAIQQFGDELSLHYHTFKWTDYDGDGIYWWNQSLTFSECEDDWDVTLAQYLIEEQIFPVSYRSGWHYMDNDWQTVLNEWIPYSMHNDWPANRVDNTEPLDNTYNWSLSPSTFSPFRPLQDNYQLPGGDRGWNLRSAHFNTVRYDNLMDTLFYKANQGEDQIACLWGHLPEYDFLTNIEILDSLAHQVNAEYPDVEFQYCSAVEAMQLWRGTADTIAPTVTIEMIDNGESVLATITVSEPLFMTKPFVALKDRYEQYTVIHDLLSIDETTWQAELPLAFDDIGVFAVAATDTAGNIGIGLHKPLPDDIYIDNLDESYIELYGDWQTSDVTAWGINSRVSVVSPEDSAIVSWIWTPTSNLPVNIFYQIPGALPAGQNIEFIITHALNNDTVMVTYNEPYDWIYVATVVGETESPIQLIQRIANTSQTPVSVFADVVKISAYVRNLDIELPLPVIHFGEVSQSDTILVNFPISNQGIEPLVIESFFLSSGMDSPHTGAIVIPAMATIEVPLQFFFPEQGYILDTLLIESSDPIDPIVRVPMMGEVGPYFLILDNENMNQYLESGTWYTSNAQAYGSSSRYAWLNGGSWATFFDKVPTSGEYNIYEIVPTTINASNKAVYHIYIGNVHIDSIEINQNIGSGSWYLIGRYTLPADSTIRIDVTDPGGSTVGQVLRADAIKIQWANQLTIQDEEKPIMLPTEYGLGVPYPNPFNSTVHIPWKSPHGGSVRLTIYDLRGKRIKRLIDKNIAEGHYSTPWNGTNSAGNAVASGTYFILLEGNNNKTFKQKVMYLK